MQKYTLVYSDGRMYGSHYSAVTRSKRIETDDIGKTINSYDGAVWFAFEGWPRQAEETEEEFNASLTTAMVTTDD